MSAPRPKRHLNRKNASAQDFTDYEDPPGVDLKPSNASTGTIYNFTRHPLDIFGIDVSPPSKIDDITGNITTLASEAGTSYQTAAAIASSTVIGFRSPRNVEPLPPLPVPPAADVIMQANDDDAASLASTTVSLFGGADGPWENEHRIVRNDIRTAINAFKAHWLSLQHVDRDIDDNFDLCTSVDQQRVQIVQRVNRFAHEVTLHYSSNKECDRVVLRKVVQWVKHVKRTLDAH